MGIINSVFGLWLVIITARYSVVVLRALRSPINTGADRLWAAAWVVVIAILILAYRLLPPIHVSRTVPVLLATASVSMLILSQTFIPFAFGCWILVVTAGLGLLVVERLFQNNDGSLERLIIAIPLGFSVLSLAIFVLGWFHILTPVAVWALLIAGSIPAAIGIRRLQVTRPLLKPMTAEGRILLGVIGLITVLNLTWAIAPEIQYDALNYHLHVPKTYLQNSGFVEIPFLQAYFAKMIEYFLTLCMTVGGTATSKFWIFLMGICATGSVFALGNAIFNERVGLWAAAFFHTTLLVVWLFGTVDIDVVIAFFVTSTFLAVIRWLQTRRAGWYYAACLLGAVAVGSKMNAGFPFIIFAPAMVHKSRKFVIGLLAFLLVALPSYALVYAYTGNPIFPLFNKVFQSPKWEAGNSMINAADFGLQKCLSNIVRLPFRMTFDTSRFGEALPRGALGVCLLLAFPFAGWFVKERPWIGGLIVGTAIGYLIVFFYTMQYGRYYIHILPLIAVLGVATAFHFGQGRIAGLVSFCLWGALLVQPLCIPLQYWNNLQRFPVSVAFGAESREAFLRRTVLGYEAAMYLNKVASLNETILGVGSVDSVRFYLNPKLETVGTSLRNSNVWKIAARPSNAELAVEMKQLGYTRIFTTRSELQSPPSESPYLNSDFLRNSAILEFEDRNSAVYRLK